MDPSGMLTRPLAMQGGADQLSYDHNCQLQAMAFLRASPTLLHYLATCTLPGSGSAASTFNIADLGCSSGKNSIQQTGLILSAIQKRIHSGIAENEPANHSRMATSPRRPPPCQEMDADNSGQKGLGENDYLHQDPEKPSEDQDINKIVADRPAIMVFFSDLPSNDFNTLITTLYDAPSTFSSAPLRGRAGSTQSPFWSEGVLVAVRPGSFYDRLFPPRFLHLVTCTLALHWMSKVPDEVVFADCQRNSEFCNPGTIWLHASQSQSCIDAYSAQAKRDMVQFLSHRAQEMVSGGVLWLMTLGRTDSDPASRNVPGNNSKLFVNLVDDAWRALIAKGSLTQESLDRFNLPRYGRSTKDVEEAVDALDGHPFQIERLWCVPFLSPVSEHYRQNRDKEDFAEKAVAQVRVVVERMIASAIGQENANNLMEEMKTILRAEPDPYLESVDEYVATTAILCRR